MRAIFAILALIVGLVPASAASLKDIDNRDRPLLAREAVVTSNGSWSGLWAAALAGYSMSNSELNFDIFAETEDGRESANLAHVDGFGGEGWDFTAQLGGDIQLGRFVVGAFGEYAFGGIESKISIFEGSARLDVEQQDSASILARAGITTSDNNTLIYVATGYTWMNVEATLRAGDESESRDYDFGGIPLELGVEHKFGPNVRGKLAARYTWFDEETVLELGDEEFGGRLTAEPGVFSVKAGVVISTSGLSVFGN